MATDRNKKSLRTFQCRDYLWEYFEHMSGELECSVDYLINEAMRQYARARAQQARSGGAPSQPSKRPVSGPQAPSSSSGSIPSIRTTGSGSHPHATTGSGSHASIPAPPSGQRQSSSGAFAAPPPAPPQAAAPPPAPPQAAAPPPPPPSASGAAAPPPPPPDQGEQEEVTPRPSAPPPLPGRPHAQSGEYAAASAHLYLIFNGQKIPVTKEEFVIGRGAKHADLPIKDGNISRRHAAIVFQEGQYFMKDLGSTNGIEYGGQRVEARRIDEGDVFHLCDYELRFTYQ